MNTVDNEYSYPMDNCIHCRPQDPDLGKVDRDPDRAGNVGE